MCKQVVLAHNVTQNIMFTTFFFYVCIHLSCYSSKGHLQDEQETRSHVVSVVVIKLYKEEVTWNFSSHITFEVKIYTKSSQRLSVRKLLVLMLHYLDSYVKLLDCFKCTQNVIFAFKITFTVFIEANKEQAYMCHLCELIRTYVVGIYIMYIMFEQRIRWFLHTSMY